MAYLAFSNAVHDKNNTESIGMRYFIAKCTQYTFILLSIRTKMIRANGHYIDMVINRILLGDRSKHSAHCYYQLISYNIIVSWIFSQFLRIIAKCGRCNISYIVFYIFLIKSKKFQYAVVLEIQSFPLSFISFTAKTEFRYGDVQKLHSHALTYAE